ncbi:hypothetical protein OPV22_000677 [Ensete ventricosum]|uniref:Uncharacterized protein n=1 Tax=Ensete ventricosum TaxID=4639 RepID=A0AAV8RS75_ENSVE|nr:hypothetical protein OPV22_000677 [Ensete ventricosum]
MSPPLISLQGDLKDLLEALHVVTADSFLPTSGVAISGLTILEFSLILPKDPEQAFFLLFFFFFFFFFFPRASFLPLHESKPLSTTVQEGELLVLRVLLASSPVSAIAVPSLWCPLHLVSICLPTTLLPWYLEGRGKDIYFFCDGASSDNTTTGCSEGTGKKEYYNVTTETQVDLQGDYCLLPGK